MATGTTTSLASSVRRGALECASDEFFSYYHTVREKQREGAGPWEEQGGSLRTVNNTSLTLEISPQR